MGYKPIALSIILLAFCLRFFSLADRPHDLYVDEVSIGYNAYSILSTGKDEHGQFLPLWFKAFGEYKLPVYIYLTTISEWIFGLTPFAVRFPSALLGTATVAVFFLFLKLTTHNVQLTTIASLLLAISPWHLQFSRAGFEADAALFFFVCGTYLILLSQNLTIAKNGDKKLSAAMFFLGAVCFIITLYTYNAYRIMTPIWFVILTQGLASLRSLFSMRAVFLFLLCLPFLLFATSPEGMIRATSESFLHTVRAKPDDFFTNQLFLTTQRLLRNYLSYFSLDFLFFSGDQNAHHSVREMGMAYMWQLPFFLIGVIGAILSISQKLKVKSQNYNSKVKSNNLQHTTNNLQLTTLVLFWFLLAPLPAAVGNAHPHALRSLAMVIPVTYFTAYGIHVVMQNSKFKIQNYSSTLKISTSILPFAFCLLVYYSMASYLHIYYVHYPKRTDPDWAGGYRDAIEELLKRQDTYDTVLITDEMGWEYIYVAFYTHLDPAILQRLPDRRKQIGRFRFIHSPYSPIPGKKILYLAPHWEKESYHPANVLRYLGVIRNRGNDEVFHLWEN